MGSTAGFEGLLCEPWAVLCHDGISLSRNGSPSIRLAEKHACVTNQRQRTALALTRNIVGELARDPLHDVVNAVG